MHDSIKKDLSVLLEVDESELKDQYRVVDHNLWDSLSMISMMSSIARHYQTSIAGEALELCQTVGDICRLLPQEHIMSAHG